MKIPSLNRHAFLMLFFALSCAPPAWCQEFTVLTLDGRERGMAERDGWRPEARLYSAAGIVVADGVIVFSERRCNTIRVAGEAQMQTLAGSCGMAGYQEGIDDGIRLNSPSGITADGDDVFVTDTANHCIRRIPKFGSSSLVSGKVSSARTADGTLAEAEFSWPMGIVRIADGEFAVTDSTDAVIRRISISGNRVWTLAGSPGKHGTTDGVGSAARFQSPKGIAVGVDGVLYVADSASHTIRRVSSGGEVTTLAGKAGEPGFVDGTAQQARFSGPEAVSFGEGRLFVADTKNHAIRAINPSQGSVQLFAGNPLFLPGYRDSIGVGARFDEPSALGFDATKKRLIVGENNNPTLRAVELDATVTTLWGESVGRDFSDELGSLSGVVDDGDGCFLVSDARFMEITEYCEDGSAAAVAGQRYGAGLNDGLGTAARFLGPAHLVRLGESVIVTDAFGATVRRLDEDGTVTTIAGSPGNPGYADGNGTSARFTLPVGVARDGENIVVADSLNFCLRSVTPSGDVTTLAGIPGVFGAKDGLASSATFGGPVGVATSNGVVYVCDASNQTIRQLKDGYVTTFAGSTGISGGEDGPLGDARFSRPVGICIDRMERIWIADAFRLRYVEPETSEVRTIAGTERLPGWEDGTGTVARFEAPNQLSCGENTVAVADRHSVRIVREASPADFVIKRKPSEGVFRCTPTSPVLSVRWRLVRIPFGVSPTLEEDSQGLTIKIRAPGLHSVEMRATDSNGRVAIRRHSFGTQAPSRGIVLGDQEASH